MPMKRKYDALNRLEETPLAMIIRAFLAFPLKPACVWDVGCGTGKVLIESSLRYPQETKLIGLELNPAYPEVMRRNMERHEVPESRIDIQLRNVCHDDLSDLERPDAIYLSCAGSAEIDIIPKLWDILLPGGVIVCNVGQQGRNPAIPEWLKRVHNAHKRFGGKLDDYTTYHDLSRNNLHKSSERRRWVVEDCLHWEGRKPV